MCSTSESSWNTWRIADVCMQLHVSSLAAVAEVSAYSDEAAAQDVDVSFRDVHRILIRFMTYDTLAQQHEVKLCWGMLRQLGGPGKSAG